MYRFLWKPKWILSHVLILVLIVSMIMAMLWQLRRLDEKQTRNELITARADIAPALVADAFADAGVTSPADGEAVEYRSAFARGTYLADEEFTIPSKTLNGAPGRLVVTPLQTADGQPPLLVLRGFIPQAIDDTDAPIDGIEPPAGPVEVRGWLRQTQVPEGLQSTKADLGADSFARIDIERIQRARGTEFAPAYLLLGAQAPPSDAPSLSLYPLPERSEGPHFSYAVQWAVFTIIALVGYPLVLRRVARGGSKDRRDDVPSEPDAPDGPDERAVTAAVPDAAVATVRSP